MVTQRLFDVSCNLVSKGFSCLAKHARYVDGQRFVVSFLSMIRMKEVVER